MTRLLQCMPMLLILFKDEGPHWYEIICSFKFHNYLNMLVDGLQKLNKLDIEFQCDMVDITTISGIINIIISTFITSFLGNHLPGTDLCLVGTSKIWEYFQGNL
jgi:hypothetical protein